MITILKGLLALPVVAFGIGLVCLVGALVVGVVGCLVTALCIIVPYLLRLTAVGVVVLFPLWVLGKIMGEFVNRDIRCLR